MKINLYRLRRKGARAALITAGAVLMSMAVPFGTTYSVYATTKEEAEQQKEEAQEGKAEAEQKAAEYQAKVDEIVAAVQELDAQTTSLSEQILEKQSEQETLETEIEDTQTKLAEAQVSEDNQYAAMKKRIQYLYEEGNVEYIDALMSSASFEDSLNKSEYVDQLSSYDQTQLDELIETRQQIASYEATLQQDLTDVETVKAELETQKSDLDELIAAKNAEITKYNSDIETQQALAASFEQMEAEADEELAQIAAEEAARLAEQIAKQQQQQQSSSSGSSSSGSGSSGSGSSTGTGSLLWPVSTGGSITSGYGARTSPTAGASTNHMGIDIGCSYGDAILAADSGTVTFAGYGASGGNYIIIDHGNGMTTMYLHNSSLAVSAGDTVSRGQVIAYAGSTGVSTGTHCHFSVLINGSYVNPQNYL